jgi:hypothetical protein
MLRELTIALGGIGAGKFSVLLELVVALACIGAGVLLELVVALA